MKDVLRPWTLDGATVASALGTDPARGLPVADATRRLLDYGRNELTERGTKPAWVLFLEQFTNAMIVVLLAAAGITAVLGDLKDTLVILAIVILNGIVGFVQEYRARGLSTSLQ